MLTRSHDISRLAEGDLFSVPGLRGAAVKTGTKPSGDLDLALIVADSPMAVAGMFTTSAVAAANIDLCREQLAESDQARAIVINAGNANALTGEQGRKDAEAMLQALEKQCGGPGLVLSTGIIGVPLNTQPILAGIEEAAGALSAESGNGVTRAILTTDTRPKTAAVRVHSNPRKKTFTVGGIAKGCGMIHPNMATMLAVIATDAPIGAEALRGILAHAVDHSFHEISVDGDTSTNDAVLLLARQPGPEERALDDAELVGLQSAITSVAQELATQIVRDGEGVSRIMRVVVDGAESEDEARRVAKSIACSSLVKTALAGADPNWGRILAAAGVAGVPLRAEDLTLRLGDHVAFHQGSPVAADAEALNATFAADEVHVRLSLGRGGESAQMLTTDLSKRYVEINSEYTT